MEESKFRELVDNILCPLLGSLLSNEKFQSTKREHEASILESGGGRELVLKPDQDTEYKIKMTRVQKFSPDELKITKDLCKEIGSIAKVNNQLYEEELIKNVTSRIVVKQFPQVEDTLKLILNQFDSWSSQTYEGKKISYSIGIQPNINEIDTINISGFFNETFSPVITNGYDTLLVVSQNMNIIKFEQLSHSIEINLLAPYRLQYLANWADNDKVVVVLNQQGEILIFTNKQLKFAKRRGIWLHYYLDCVTARLSPPRLQELRTAILESCIDVSFSRSGACIGVISESKINQFKVEQNLINVNDQNSNIKKQLFSTIFSTPFYKLDRRLRQELLAIDGALVMDHKGKLLGIGEIIKVPGAERGGGRTLAAQTLSKFGLGIKVSSDGQITAFRNAKDIFSI